jgi:uncharacterized cupin superfamily protein
MTAIQILNVASTPDPEPVPGDQSVVRIDSIWDGTGAAADVSIASGIAKMTPGLHDAVVKGDEVACVVSGTLTVTDRATGEELGLKTGDTLFMPKNTPVSWNVAEFTTIVYVMIGH